MDRRIEIAKEDAEEIIYTARKEAADIIEKAQKQARDIVTQARRHAALLEANHGNQHQSRQ